MNLKAYANDLADFTFRTWSAGREGQEPPSQTPLLDPLVELVREYQDLLAENERLLREVAKAEVAHDEKLRKRRESALRILGGGVRG